MKIFGLEIARVKAQTLSAVPTNRNWLGMIRESFPGAWQRGVVIDAPRDVLAFSAVFACVTVISSDIAKLRIKLVEENEQGIWTEIKTGPPWLAVLRKPNHYQTRIKFVEQWITSKLLYGNTYVLKERDQRGVVNALYILDATKVTPLVAEDGSVYYRLALDHLSGLQKQITVPASEIIHDMMVSLWHPLVGASPITACGVSATMGNKIQANSTTLFARGSRPSGLLSAPDITEEQAQLMQAAWETNYSGTGYGKTAVLAGGLKYESMAMPADDAQLIEQLKWTVEDVARCFHIPAFKLGGPVPAGSSIELLNQMYYSECLQSLLESFELCLDEGFALPPNYFTEFDLDGLLRMDTAAMVKAEAEAVGAGIKSPDEARKRLNLPAVPGGDTPYLQQQYWGLEQLSKRTAAPDGVPIAAPQAPAANDDEEEAKEEKKEEKVAARIMERVQAQIAEAERVANMRFDAAERDSSARLVQALAARDAAALEQERAGGLLAEVADQFIMGLDEHATA